MTPFAITLRATLAGGAALGALAWAGGAAAASADEEARIAKLEAAVAALQAQVQAQSGLAAENVQLKAQVTGLEAQVSNLETSTEAKIAVAKAEDAKAIDNTKPSVITAFVNGRPSWTSADGRFSLNLHAMVQLDSGVYDQAAPGPITTDLRRSGPALGSSASNVDFTHARQLKDGVIFRRARAGIDGTVFTDFQYKLVFDFGGAGTENAGQLYEAWAQYSGLKPLKIRVGAFAPLEGLEDQANTSSQPFLERPVSSDLARGLAGGDTRVSAQAFATTDRWLASLALTTRAIGVLNTGSPTGTPQTYRDPLGLVGRVSGVPFEGKGWKVHAGVHGSYVISPADVTGPPTTATPTASQAADRYVVSFSERPELRVDGTKLINTGNIGANHAGEIGAELAGQWGPLFAQGEYDHFAVSRRATAVTNPSFNGWYVEGSWIVTGQARKYNTDTGAFDGPPVPKPVGSGGFGDVELALRWSEMNLNYAAGAPGTVGDPSAIRGGDSQIFSAAVNWYLTSIARLSFEYQHVNLQRLSPDAVNYQTPTGAQIGQSYNAFSVRSQLAF